MAFSWILCLPIECRAPKGIIFFPPFGQQPKFFLAEQYFVKVKQTEDARMLGLILATSRHRSAFRWRVWTVHPEWVGKKEKVTLATG